jgi:hypothetical protein
MRFRALTVILVSGLLWILASVYAPAVLALTQIKLFDIGYRDCPPEIAKGWVTSGGVPQAANCFVVFGKAENKTGKPVVNADVFGRIYDANHDSVLQNRTRLGAIAEIPPGISDFDFIITVAANQPQPLQLEQLKAAGFTGKVRR